MTNIIVIAPLAVFLSVMLLVVGWHGYVNRLGVIARERVGVFAPGIGQATGAGPASVLIERKRLSDIGLLNRLLQASRSSDRLSKDLMRAGLPWRVGEYLMGRSLAGCVLGVEAWHFTGGIIPGLVGFAVGFAAPVAFVRWKQKSRSAKFDDQLVDALVLIANALRAGFSFMQGMQAVAEEMPEPMGPEFRQALGEARAGGSVEDALLGITQRVTSEDFELVLTATLIQRQVGGNLTEVISSIVNTIRERHRIQGEIRVLSAEERLTSWILGLLPLGLMVVLQFVGHGYIQNLLNDPAGRLLLVIGLVLEAIGFVFIRRAIAIDV
ncbi:MAG TPA: type II secretion system F family protein [Chloroflexota bacterium]